VNITSKPNRADYSFPLPVRRALHKLGQDIRSARLRRRLPAAVVAERASISRTTLFKLEKGGPGVSIGNVGTVLFVLGMGDRLGELVDVRRDEHGLALEEERLPQRIRPRRRHARKQRSTAIDDDDPTASLELALSVAAYFELDRPEAEGIAGEVADVVSAGREEAGRFGLTLAACNRMESAFVHADQQKYARTPSSS
jgi:DNA-binding XRE family transcriptional regulator